MSRLRPSDWIPPRVSTGFCIAAVGLVLTVTAGTALFGADHPTVSAPPVSASQPPSTSAVSGTPSAEPSSASPAPSAGRSSDEQAAPQRPAPTPSKVTGSARPAPRRPLSAEQVAAAWATAGCNYSWQSPYGSVERAQAPYSTRRLRGEQSLTAAGAASWNANVILPRKVSRCRALGTLLLTSAPQTATVRHIRVQVRVVTKAGTGAAVQTEDYYPVRLLAQRGGGWLVDGIAAGG